MPFLSFPDPPGPYAVGQCDCFWKEEWSTAEKKQQLVVRIFYPVDKDVAEKYEMAHWLPERNTDASASQYAEAYAKFMWKPGTIQSWLGSLAFLPLMGSIATKTVDSAPAAQTPEKFRPVIYSHGLGGNRSCYSQICIGLASHGYFVVAPEHTDGSAAITIHPDQTVVNHTYVPARSQLTGKQHRIPGGFTSTLIPERDTKPITQYQLRRKQLDHRVAEVRFLVDCLEHVTGGDARVPLPEHLAGHMKGRLDMDRLSAVGHSFGASTCITACKQDMRFKACVAHDAWLFPLSGEMMQSALRVPTLFLIADTFDMLWPEEGKKVLDSFLLRSHEEHVDVQAVAVVGTKHQNYSDFPVLAPDLLMSIGVAGPTDPVKAAMTVHRLDSSFLEHCLSGTNTTVYSVPEDIKAETKAHEVDAWIRTRSMVRVGVFTNDSEAGAKNPVAM